MTVLLKIAENVHNISVLRIAIILTELSDARNVNLESRGPN